MPTSLQNKLQIKSDELLIMNSPAGYIDVLAHQLKGIRIEEKTGGRAAAVLLLVNSLAEAEQFAPWAIKAVKENGLLWIAYPKGSSGVKTDVNRDKLWPVIARFGWRPVRQVAIDEVWSAMRFKPGELPKALHERHKE